MDRERRRLFDWHLLPGGTVSGDAWNHKKRGFLRASAVISCLISLQGYEEVIPFEYHNGYLTVHFEANKYRALQTLNPRTSRFRKLHVAPVI